jgi:asparagine synthase (glutamine-hydrolysing)
MCGIVGYAGRSGGMDSELLATMRDALVHRGPDAAGTWSAADCSVVLGHRRLSILDLSPTGHQPMPTQAEELVIVFNGEIYNHDALRVELRKRGATFVGRSDTEVILAAYREWGEECPQRLRGMFAFAIYDSQRRTLFLARDRVGEKPLYWARHRDGLVFASELKALIADPAFHPRLDPRGVAFYLSFGYVPAEHCILKGVNKLKAGHCLTFSIEEDVVRARRYWDIPRPDSADVADREQLVGELEQLIVSAVGEQLVADVPVAVLLSGGVDSSVVTAIAARTSGRPIRTFTITIPGSPSIDEAVHAKKVADHFATQHVQLPIDPSSLNVLHDLSVQFDEPISDSSMIPTYLLARTVSQHCKVVLGGDGADELFGGYRAYQGTLHQARVRALLPRPVRDLVSLGARILLPTGMKRRNGLIGLAGSVEDGIAQIGVMFDRGSWRTLSPWLADQEIRLDPVAWRRDLVEADRGVPGAAMAADFRTYLPEDVLTKVDRASMLSSLEVRAPFLDHRIVEFAYGRVPNALRVSATQRKIVLKDLARRILPADLDLERKQGFSIPLSSWLTPKSIQEWREDCQREIAALLSPAAISWKRARVNEGMFQRVFALMMITLWMRHYRISL